MRTLLKSEAFVYCNPKSLQMKGKEMSFLSSVDWRVGAFAVLRRPNGNVS